MMNVIHRFAGKIGMDKAIAYSSIARVIQGGTGVISIFFISAFLSGIEQGYYFTFGSILALQVFFELGLTGIMTQYVAHEVSHLTLKEDGEYEGESVYKSRLASLIHFCYKWYLILAIVAVFFLLIVGFIYFKRFGDTQDISVQWQVPWGLVCIVTSIQLFISPFTSILSGLGFVKETSKILFYQQLIVPICTWIGLALGCGLFVIGISHLLSIVVWLVIVWKSGLFSILKKLWFTHVIERVDYIKEIFPYQWKIAISWVSGYFIFQLFNPVLFATEGAIVAGQMGMTLTALNAISAFSMSWLNTKIPSYSKLIAHKEYNKLDYLFNKTLRQMWFVCMFLLSVFFLVLKMFRVLNISIGDGLLADRFLDSLPLVLMMIPIVINQFNNSWATYLRCHKQEPLLLYSIVAGVLSMLSTLLFGKLYGLYGVTIGYFTIRLLMIPWIYSIYKIKKQEWHEKS